jgi:ABC-2 type transport system permease protein
MTVATSVSRPKAGLHYRVSSVMGAEWIKMRSVRSTIWTLTAMTVITLGIAIIAGAVIPAQWHTFPASQRATFDPTSISLRGLLFGQLVIGVLGVMVMSAEYGTGTIRATLAAIPNRPLIVAAKAAVFAMVAAVAGQVLSFGAFFIAQALLSSPARHASLGQPGVLRAVVGSGLIIPVLGLFALGLATIIRYTAGAITAYVGTLLVLPITLDALPSSFSHPILNCLPLQIGDTMASVVSSPGSGWTLSPWAGFGVLCLYALAALVIGAWMMVRRDA